MLLFITVNLACAEQWMNERAAGFLVLCVIMYSRELECIMLQKGSSTHGGTISDYIRLTTRCQLQYIELCNTILQVAASVHPTVIGTWWNEKFEL